MSPAIKLPEPKYFKKVAGRLKSINYIYKKIDGLNEKCKQLVPAGNEILASTNKGLFVISGHKARAIVSNAYINYISPRSKDNKYYVATYRRLFLCYPDNRWQWIARYPDKIIHTADSIPLLQAMKILFGPEVMMLLSESS